MPKDETPLEFVQAVARLTLFSESEEKPSEDGPAPYEWLVSNHEALEALILAAREIVARETGKLSD
jgi:hypothetical protein